MVWLVHIPTGKWAKKRGFMRARQYRHTAYNSYVKETRHAVFFENEYCGTISFQYGRFDYELGRKQYKPSKWVCEDGTKISTLAGALRHQESIGRKQALVAGLGF